MKDFVLVAHIVTFNHERTIARALEGLLAQTGFELGRSLIIRVTDNLSSDNTCDIVRKFSPQVELLEQRANLGFTGAHNLAIERALQEKADFFFILNPDVFLHPDALKILTRALEADSRCGSISPKLLRAGPDLEPIHPPRFDTTGMYITPEVRHFDRGSNELDQGQYEKSEYVFGASGAAMLCKASFLRDIALPPDSPDGIPQVFDNLFFAYREDADLAWRSQWHGWKCRYEPKAIGYHTRKVLPENRSELPAALNAHSVRNRFLLQINNILGPQFWPRKIFRNLIVQAGVVFKEHESRPALRCASALAPVALRHRAWTKRHRRVSSTSMSRWFSTKPYAEPALELGDLSAPSHKSLTIVIVNFNSASRLEKCLRQLRSTVLELSEKYSIQTCVVDNGSVDQSLEGISELEMPNFSLHAMTKNLGFAGAINYAVHEHPAWGYLILNPDISLEAAALEALVNALEVHDDVAAAAPVLIDNAGRPQWEYLKLQFPSLRSLLSGLFGMHQIWPRNPCTGKSAHGIDRFVRRYVLDVPFRKERPQESRVLPLLIAQPAGACLLIRALDFQKLGGFDENFWPAWFEDVDFCKRLSDIQKKCVIVGSARVLHEGGYSYRYLGRAEFARIWYPNLLRYFRKHSSTFRFAILRALLPVALLARAAVAAAHSIRHGSQSFENRKLAGALFRLAFDPSSPKRTY